MPKIVARNRIQEWRRRRDLTLEELATKVCDQGFQISFQRISKLERGAVRLTVETLGALAKALQVAPSDLMPAHDGKRLSVIGFVDTGVVTLGASSMDTVACPPGCDPERTDVLEIKEPAGFMPKGWLIFYERLAGVVPDAAVNQLCVCQTEEGDLVTGMLLRGMDGRFHIARTMATSLMDVRLIAAGRILAAMPRDIAVAAAGDPQAPGC